MVLKPPPNASEVLHCLWAKRISGPWDERLPKPECLLLLGLFLVLPVCLSVDEGSIGLGVQGSLQDWAICCDQVPFSGSSPLSCSISFVEFQHSYKDSKYNTRVKSLN